MHQIILVYIILTLIPRMISERDRKIVANKNNNNIGKTAKPFSVLSLGLIKMPGNASSHRSRQIIDVRKTQKFLLPAQISENNQPQVIPICSQSKISFSTKVFSSKNTQNDREFSNIVSSMTSIDLPIFSDRIHQRESVVRLQNITNKFEESISQKIEQTKIVNINKYFIEERQELGQEERKDRIYVDMKKKIKKADKAKNNSRENQKHQGIQVKIETASPRSSLQHKLMLGRIYSDSDIIVDGIIFRNKLISQRIDNDVDTDDQQIASGIRRLHKSLSDAIQQNKIWQGQKQQILSMEEQKGFINNQWNN